MSFQLRTYHKMVFKLTILLLCSTVAVFGAPNNRIIGGHVAAEGEFPYLVSIRIDGDHQCGGSIINHATILTAAHCVSGVHAYDLTVVAGSNKLDEGGDTYNIGAVIVHEEWNPNTIANDIALLKTSSDIQFSSKVYKVIMTAEETQDGAKTILAGWGLTSYPGSSPNELVAIDLPYLNRQDCAKILENVGNVTEGNICTLTEAGQGVCRGDSGGPLVNENFDQIGIVSWGVPCGTGQPDVYTHVEYYSLWIWLNS